MGFASRVDPAIAAGRSLAAFLEIALVKGKIAGQRQVRAALDTKDKYQPTKKC
jgi:hypothetical protein